MAKHGAKVRQEQRARLGTRTMYAGMVETSCKTCGARQRKGMVSVYKGERFCSEACVVEYADVNR